MTSSDHLPAARLAARLLLQQMAEAGVDLALPRTAPPMPLSPAAETAPKPSLGAIAGEIQGCQACPLAAGRQQTVPGEGHPQARLMIVGEGPGAEEDQSGRPFVGAAGQLLEKILRSGMGLERGQVFISNMVKCRPPENRNPQPEELAACAHYLEAQIQAIQPELILALGKVAAQALLATEAPLGQLRGHLHPRPQGGPPVLATYHPAYLLRRPEEKAACWADIQLAMGHLGLSKPTSS